MCVWAKLIALLWDSVSSINVHDVDKLLLRIKYILLLIKKYYYLPKNKVKFTKNKLPKTFGFGDTRF